MKTTMAVLLLLASNALLADVVFINDEIVAAAVPEPGTLALLGFGVAGLVIARRRKK